ncbi:MAG: hypothetical protein QF483_04555 [Gammaproteobacteria bacterium]|nr:hypothetical protein [Chromatiales bacterium]MCP4924740.1 hypothetical protein [Gammaproteobacteria bacterium]MDP7297164.1 hypothetical protein [Gammaproteobacteria bacterium]MDP7419129.1 hypothetical protein [Gammaproteobacteria bacterium]MDP7659991.1 hypothetical protein [Gammaproteobacteria bacterium]
MRSAIGAWLIERRIARVALIATLLPLFGVISAAIVVCVAIQKGWRESLLDCLIALVLVLGLTVMVGDGVAQVLFSSVSTWGIALLMGGLTGLYGSLILTIQAIIVLGCLALIGFAALVGNPAEFWGPILQIIIEQMQALNVELTVVNAIMELVPYMSGLLIAGTLASSIVALLLGCWWVGNVGGVSTREQFLDLRLGYVVGGIAAVAGIGSLLGMQPLAANLLLVASFGFLFQGIAVLHWHVAKRKLPWYLLIPVYLPAMMGPGFLIILFFLFAMVGFIDNWFSLRRATAI